MYSSTRFLLIMPLNKMINKGAVLLVRGGHIYGAYALAMLDFGAHFCSKFGLFVDDFVRGVSVFLCMHCFGVSNGSIY